MIYSTLLIELKREHAIAVDVHKKKQALNPGTNKAAYYWAIADGLSKAIEAIELVLDAQLQVGSAKHGS